MKPKIVGYWAVQVTPQLDLIKFGKDGDTVLPEKSPSQAIKRCMVLKKQEPNCQYYILRMFDNGQMKTFYAFD